MRDHPTWTDATENEPFSFSMTGLDSIAGVSYLTQGKVWPKNNEFCVFLSVTRYKTSPSRDLMRAIMITSSLTDKTANALAANVYFYPRDAMLARVIVIATCLSVRPSVCLSRAGIVSKRRKLATWFLHHLVAPRLQFSDAKFHHQIPRGSLRTGASNKGRSEKFSDFLALSVNISKTAADTAKVTISD